MEGELSKYARKVDNNHGEIKMALIGAGYKLWDCSSYGKGMSDLLVMSKSNRFVALEVKQPKGKLTHDEVQFFSTFEGAPVYVVRSIEDALETMRIEDEK